VKVAEQRALDEQLQDPLQLPETAGATPRIDDRTAAWLAWVAVSIAVAMAGAYGLALVGFVGVELAVMAFAWGCAWSAMTPTVLRRIKRWVR
jgi:hypothetical protein